MRILYTTDLHGNKGFYRSVLKIAQSERADMIINGGDMLPKAEPIYPSQKNFLEFLENEHFPIIEEIRIYYLCQLGNDDLRIYDRVFDKICKKFNYVKNIAQSIVEIDGLEFIGFNLVADYPFGLKDRCRRDTEIFKVPKQYDIPVFSCADSEWEIIQNWSDEIKKMATLSSELDNLPKPKDSRKSIYVIHMPPAGLGLDQTVNDDRPESLAVRKFLETHQPLLSFHGHIHNSYQESGIWKAELKKTTCVQPGQDNLKLVYVSFDTESMELNRYSQ